MKYLSLLVVGILACGSPSTDLVQPQDELSTESLTEVEAISENPNGSEEATSQGDSGNFCTPGKVVCHGNNVAQCNEEGTELNNVEPCYANEICFEGSCVEQQACTWSSCGNPLHCPKTYPSCPYGTQFGEIAENTSFLDPSTDSKLELADLYDPKNAGLIALIAANGW
jgi:hypothetical protein